MIVDDVLLPLYRQLMPLHRFRKVLVFPSPARRCRPSSPTTRPAGRRRRCRLPDTPPHDENDPIAMCYTSGTTGRPKGVAYSHRSTVLHTLVGSLGDFWGLKGTDVVMPVTPMFHANSWGMPYGAVMMGAKLVFPGPHLHPDDLLDLMQLEPAHAERWACRPSG
jgi:fatty-acyl-CoA synthase